jgi:hypothetical protein
MERGPRQEQPLSLPLSMKLKISTKKLKVSRLKRADLGKHLLNKGIVFKAQVNFVNLTD